jgi:hypothetical protein
MSFGVDFPNISGTSLYNTIDTFVPFGTTVSTTSFPNGALNMPGSVWQMPVQQFSQYAGFNSLYAPSAIITGTTTNGSAAITALTSTSQIVVGQSVSGAGIPVGATVATITSATAITISANATAGATVPLAFGLGTKIFNGFPPIVKYVRYNSTANPAISAAPAVVYYTDETGTTVTGVPTEANGGVGNGNINMCAGVLLYNTTTSGLTGAASATALNGNWCWIQVGGLSPAVKVVTGLVGSTYLASPGTNFTVTNQAAATNAYPYFLGTQMSVFNSTAGTADVLINPLLALL